MERTLPSVPIGEVSDRYLLEQALLAVQALTEKIHNMGATMSNLSDAVDRLVREVGETREAVDAANDLRAELDAARANDELDAQTIAELRAQLAEAQANGEVTAAQAAALQQEIDAAAEAINVQADALDAMQPKAEEPVEEEPTEGETPEEPAEEEPTEGQRGASLG